MACGPPYWGADLGQHGQTAKPPVQMADDDQPLASQQVFAYLSRLVNVLEIGVGYIAECP